MRLATELARVEDVAAYIFATRGEMPYREVQAQLMRIQAWSIDFDDAPFWTGVAGLMLGGDPARLTPAQRETVEAVLEG